MVLCAVFIEHTGTDKSLGNSSPVKWTVTDSHLSPAEAANVLQSWAAKGYAARIETMSPRPVDQTAS